MGGRVLHTLMVRSKPNIYEEHILYLLIVDSERYRINHLLAWILSNLNFVLSQVDEV